MLPLEAMELEAFRRRHGDDTFWCGLLLGGCGDQLTTKLYTDRVCHFAHHPSADGQPHQCSRRARGVASADHLYVKAAAAAWLREQHLPAEFDFAQPGGVPIGSVVDIRFSGCRLRVHLDQATAPAWDREDVEPVLGMSVPVDRDTLIRRWYVHRIRLDSEGTTRRVRIGTEAFSRPTEWFAFDECEMTDRGLSTPAVERIVRSHTTRPVASWPTGPARKAPDAQARAHALLRKLTDARRVESVVVVTKTCHELDAVADVDQETQAQLRGAVADARCWLEGQAVVRQELFTLLEEAVAAGSAEQVRPLLVRVNAIANHDRTQAESAVVEQAAEQVAALGRERQAAVLAAEAEREAVAAVVNASWRAVGRVDVLLRTLQLRVRERPDSVPIRLLVGELRQAAQEAGERLNPRQRKRITSWEKRSGLATPQVPAGRGASQPMPAKTPGAAVGGRDRQKKEVSLHTRVPRHIWLKARCPFCRAAKGKACRTQAGGQRQVPHDERLRPFVSPNFGTERTQQRSRPTTSESPPKWQVTDVACPDCGAAAGTRCTTAGGHPHHSRVARFRRRYSR